ncbi:MAG: DUF1707 domain-containing protein [Microlunatus sp.]|nr:DUF1707 domain-containing protein [Microlunatus sp.]
MGQSDHIRVGHEERDAAAAILQKAAAEGRLTLEELDERLETALQAKTYGDLRPLFADLSAGLTADLPAVLAGGPMGAVPAQQGPPSPGWSRDDPLMLDGGMSSEKRDGVWTVPPFIRISQGMGSVKLNCLQAIPAAPVIEVEMIGGAGSVVIIVPDGWGANTDRLSKSWGSKSIKVPAAAAAGKPLLVIFGGLGIGSLKVRPPSNRDLRRINRS